MNMSYDGALVMPRNYAEMNYEEMTYVEGGSVTLCMLTSFLDKNVCALWAIKVVDHRSVIGMTYQQVMEEIYAHAYVYYNFDKLPSIIKNNSFAQSVYNSSADGIHLADYGDTLGRRMFYTAVWNLC